MNIIDEYEYIWSIIFILIDTKKYIDILYIIYNIVIKFFVNYM